MNKNIVRDLELVIEMQELRCAGITEEEIIGFFDMYSDNWELDYDGTYDN